MLLVRRGLVGACRTGLLATGDEWLSVRATRGRERHTGGDRDAWAESWRRQRDDPARRTARGHLEQDRPGPAEVDACRIREPGTCQTRPWDQTLRNTAVTLPRMLAVSYTHLTLPTNRE